MDTNNSSPPPAGVTGDWRAQLAPDSRLGIVNMIMETLKRHLPFSGQEGLEELKKIAVRFEEKIYFAAENQQDYLRKISLKMITMDNKSQNTVPVPFQSNSLNNNSSSKPLIQSQLHNQGQSLPMQLPSSLQSHQQLLSQNTLKNAASAGVQASLDSTCQTGHADGVDWQEEVYQKIKALKETYLPELNEMHQKIAAKFQQIESLSQPPKREQVEKMKVFKAVLERIMAFLQIPKHSIAPNFKEKLGSYEKQIINFINSNRPRKPPSQQLGGPGQIVPTQMHSMQQSQSQITQTQSHENPVNPHAQSMNLQGSATTMQQSSIANLQHSSQSQQNMMNSPQPGSKLVSTGQGYALISMQWAPIGSSSQKPVCSPQQASKNAPQYLVLKLILILLLVIILFQMASLLQTGKSYSLAQFALVKWFGG